MNDNDNHLINQAVLVNNGRAMSINMSLFLNIVIILDINATYTALASAHACTRMPTYFYDYTGIVQS